MCATEANLRRSADPVAHPSVACFGECGVDRQPEREGQGPLAAGLFGMASRSTEAGGPIIVRGRIAPIA